MSTATLSNLRDYLYGTLTPDNMVWLGIQLTEYGSRQEDSLKPYTKRELYDMIAQAERESAAGLGQDSEEMFRELEAEFAHED